MGQVTIYLDKQILKKLKNAVEKSGMSKSKWISDVIKEKISTSWPENVKKLAGTWNDIPTAEEIRAGEERDIEREIL
jgi:metal-responsive CopG/Arc/MetJ family transcriptional regulator